MNKNNPPTNITVVHLAAAAEYRPACDTVDIAGILQKYDVPTPYILYVGSAAARKNIARLLRAFAQVQPKHPQMHLVVAGVPGWRNSALAPLVDELALGDSLYFTGFINEADLPTLYGAAHLFAFPSLLEGFGLPVLEAMACGTPVITADGSSLREIAGDAALLVDPTRVDEIATALHTLLSDKELAAALQRKGLTHVQEFSWDRVARETVEVYRQVAAGGRQVAR